MSLKGEAMMTGLSVLVMTYNEEKDISRCLESLNGVGDEIVVLDSYSTDRTVEIAKSVGARVEFHAFENHVLQRKKLLSLARHDWVLMLDADEYLSEELRSSIALARQNPVFDGYEMNRLNRIGDRWIRHGNWYPDRKIRLFQRDRFQVQGRQVHESIQPIGDARVGWLRGDLLHHSDDSFADRMKTLEMYSAKAAAELYEQGVKPSWIRMVFKPVFRFLKGYVVKLGFLDGWMGFRVAWSEGWYVWCRETKLFRHFKTKN